MSQDPPYCGEPWVIPGGQYISHGGLNSWVGYTDHPVTRPWSTIQRSFLFESTVFWRFSRLYSYMWGSRRPSDCSIQKYWSSLQVNISVNGSSTPSPHPPIMVFGGTQYMCNSLNTVYNGTGKVVGWVHSVERHTSSWLPPQVTCHVLVLAACARVGLQLTPVQGGVTHTAIDRLVVYHSTQAALQTDL